MVENRERVNSIEMSINDFLACERIRVDNLPKIASIRLVDKSEIVEMSTLFGGQSKICKCAVIIKNQFLLSFAHNSIRAPCDDDSTLL